MQRNDVEDTHGIRLIDFHDLSLHLRILSMAANVLVPYILYLTVFSQVSELDTLPIFVAYSTITLAILIAIPRRPARHRILTVCLLFTGAVAAALFSTVPSSMFTWGYPFFGVATVIRMLQLFRTNDAGEQNRLALRTDTILVIISVFLYGAIVPKGSGTVIVQIVSLSITAFAARLYSLWKIERATAAAERGVAWAMPVLVVVASGLVVVIPVLFYVVFAGGMSLLLPIGLAVIRLASLIHIHSNPNPQHPVASVSMTDHFTGSPPMNHAVDIAIRIVIIGLLFGGLIILLVVAYLMNKDSINDQLNEIKGVEVNRRWVSKSKSVDFVPTSDPIRNRYQNWLKSRHKQGQTIGHSETAREFQKRLQSEVGESVADPEKDFLTRYEQARYKEGK